MTKEKYGFVYLWYDRKHKRYYIGCRWGKVDDGYVCSSRWMKQAYGHRPYDFKRRILKTNIPSRKETYEEEQRWLNLIKEEEIKPLNDHPRYYNLSIKNNETWHKYDEKIKSIGEKISNAKTGKKIGCTPERAKAISEGKKRAFKEKRDRGEKCLPGRKWETRPSLSDDHKLKISEGLKKAYSEGKRKMADPKPTMTKEEQAKITSTTLKSRWADPVWRERQIQKLREGSARRYTK